MIVLCMIVLNKSMYEKQKININLQIVKSLHTNSKTNFQKFLNNKFCEKIL